MRKTNLLKKGIAVLLALALVGLFASCKNDAGGEKKTYTIVCDDVTLFSGLDQEDYNEIKTSNTFTENTDYTISGTTITLTDSGLTKFIAIMEAEMLEEMAEEYGGELPEGFTYEIAALVVYEPENFCYPITQSMYDFAAGKLTEDTDYILKANGKIVVLTQAGYEKASTSIPLFGDED